MSDDYDFSECDRFFEQIEPTINYGAHDDPVDVAYKFVRACYRLLRPENVDYAFKELEQRLRAARDTLRDADATRFDAPNGTSLYGEAADAIRQQAERIAILQLELDRLKQHYE